MRLIEPAEWAKVAATVATAIATAVAMMLVTAHRHWGSEARSAGYRSTDCLRSGNSCGEPGVNQILFSARKSVRVLGVKYAGSSRKMSVCVSLCPHLKSGVDVKIGVGIGVRVHLCLELSYGGRAHIRRRNLVDRRERLERLDRLNWLDRLNRLNRLKRIIHSRGW